MHIKLLALAALTAITAASSVLAVTGSTSIYAADSGDGLHSGYRNATALGFGSSYGSVSNPTLSDGNVIVEFVDASAGGGGLSIAIKGFTSDPGRGYLNHVYVSCVSYSSFESSAASYHYNSYSGVAYWQWNTYSAPYVFTCMEPQAWYSLSVD